MLNVTIAIENLKQSLISGGQTEEQAEANLVLFRDELAVNFRSIFYEYIHHRSLSLVESVVNSSDLTFWTTDLKTQFKNELNA